PGQDREIPPGAQGTVAEGGGRRPGDQPGPPLEHREQQSLAFPEPVGALPGTVGRRPLRPGLVSARRPQPTAEGGAQADAGTGGRLEAAARRRRQPRRTQGALTVLGLRHPWQLATALQTALPRLLDVLGHAEDFYEELVLLDPRKPAKHRVV